MEIDIELEPKHLIDNCNYGDTFLYCGQLYIYLESDEKINCANLENGKVDFLTLGTKVQKIKCKVVRDE